MKKVEILILEENLEKLKELGIEYELTNPDIELENFLRASTDTEDLSYYDMQQIVETAKKAIEKGTKYGIVIDLLSGKDMNDDRYYTLENVYIEEVKNGNCSYTVEELLEYV